MTTTQTTQHQTKGNQNMTESNTLPTVGRKYRNTGGSAWRMCV